MHSADYQRSFADPPSRPLAMLYHGRRDRTVVEVVPDLLDLVIYPPPGEKLRCEAIGEICTATAREFGRVVRALIPPGHWTIELDLSAVDFMDARGITMLMDLASDERVKRLRTSQRSPAVETLFDVCELDGTEWPTATSVRCSRSQTVDGGRT